jgi:hypothetical protein
VTSFKKGLSSTNGLLKCYGLIVEGNALRKNQEVDLTAL